MYIVYYTLLTVNGNYLSISGSRAFCQEERECSSGILRIRMPYPSYTCIYCKPRHSQQNFVYKKFNPLCRNRKKGKGLRMRRREDNARLIFQMTPRRATLALQLLIRTHANVCIIIIYILHSHHFSIKIVSHAPTDCWSRELTFFPPLSTSECHKRFFNFPYVNDYTVKSRLDADVGLF